LTRGVVGNLNGEHRRHLWRWAIEFRYDAFISYNHAADDDLAPAIERGLERLAKPWYRLRAISVFRDVSDTGLNPSLWGTVQRQLDGSRWFVLLACPESAASQWVRREIDHWCDTKGASKLLLVLTGGELVWDRADGRFADATTALAPEVAARFSTEPLHLDLRWTAELGRPPTLADARFRTEMARLASPIRDLPPDEIESEDVRLHRKARRLARGAVAALVALTIVATIAAVIAVRNANEAERRARQAVARQLGLAALDMPASDLDEALLVSLAASRLDPDAGPDRFLASRTLLGRHSRLVALLHTPPELGEPSLRGVAISPSGDTVAATAWPADGEPQVVRWALPDGGDPVTEPLPSTAGASVVFDADGAIVTPSSGSTLAIHPDGHLAVVADGAHVRLVRTGVETTAPPIAEWTARAAVAAVIGARAAVVADGVLHLVDTDRGVELASAPVGHDRPVGAVGVRGDDVVVASGSDVTWWSLDRSALSRSAPPIAVTDVGDIGQVALAASGQRALVAGRRGTAVVDADGVLATDDATGLVAPDPAGRFAAVVGTQLSVWNLARAQRAVSVPEPVNAAAWSGCDDAAACRLVTAGATIDVWEPGADRRIRLADQTNAQAVDITADGGTVVTAGWGPSVAVWSLTLPIDDRGREQLTDAAGVTAYDAATGTVASADGSVVVVAGDATTTIETGQVDELALTTGADWLVAEDDDVIRVFDTATGAELDLDARCLTGTWAISPRGRWLVTHDHDSRQTALCELGTSPPPAGVSAGHDDSDSSDDAPSEAPAVAVGFAVEEQAAAIESIAVDDDGAVALAGGGLVEYRPLVDGEFVRRAEAVSTGYADELVTIPRLAVRDGRVVAAVDTADGELARVLVWDARRRGTPIQFETDHTDLGAIALLGDTAELLAVAGRFGDGDTVVQVWEAESRRQLGRGLGGLGSDVRALAGDATAVVGTDADGRTFRWPLDRDPRREVCAIVGRDLSTEEWETTADGMLGRYEHDPVCDHAS
jgi:hypothetical protein